VKLVLRIEHCTRGPSGPRTALTASVQRSGEIDSRNLAPAAAGIPETVGPAEAAKALGVTEADVIASLESGDLKGKRIGSQWRITKAALAQFLQQ
jgi:excisionase family DNA binding protein